MTWFFAHRRGARDGRDRPGRLRSRRPDGRRVRRPPRRPGARRPATSAATTCGGCGSRSRSAATGCRRSTRSVVPRHPARGAGRPGRLAAGAGRPAGPGGPDRRAGRGRPESREDGVPPGETLPGVSPVIVYVLTALAAVVVVLTRLRLRRDREGAGRVDIARVPVGVHTVAGHARARGVGDVPGHRRPGLRDRLDHRSAWSGSCCGGSSRSPGCDPHPLAAGARQARSTAVEDSWSSGPGLSVLGHVGMVVGVVVFTYAYLVKAV